MATIDSKWLEEVLSPDALSHREGYNEIYDRAAEYIEGNMHDDVREWLERKYPAAQRGGQPESMISPVAVAHVQAYAEEMASAYANGVIREVFGPNGDQDEELTEQYNKGLESVGFNQVMDDLERKLVVLRSCGLYFGVENGRLDPRVVLPQDVYPIPPKDKAYNPANQRSYLGYVLDTGISSTDTGTKLTEHTYVLSTPGEQGIYAGAHPGDPRGLTSIDTQALPWTWPTPVVDKLGKPTGTIEDTPLQMLTIWHEQKPTGTLLPFFEPVAYTDNKELNVLWSVILDVMRFQAGSTAVKSVTDPDTENVNIPVGVRHPMLLGIGGESFGYANPGVDWGGLTTAIQAFTKTFGTSLALAPGDFSIEETVVQSGIAKIIANLPKNRKRKKRIKWFSHMESVYAFPRLASQMVWLGMLDPRIKQPGYTLQVSFRGDQVPLAAAERVQEEKHEIALGVTTAAQILSTKTGVPLDEAKLTINNNLGIDPEEEQVAALPLNGAQMTALRELVTAVAAGEVPSGSAAKAIALALQISEADARAILADIPDVYGAMQEEKQQARQRGAENADQPPQFEKDELKQPKKKPRKRGLLQDLVRGNLEKNKNA